MLTYSISVISSEFKTCVLVMMSIPRCRGDLFARPPRRNNVAINRNWFARQTWESLIRQSCTYYYYVLMPQISNIKCKNILPSLLKIKL